MHSRLNFGYSGVGPVVTWECDPTNYMWVTIVYRFLCTLLHRATESERGGSQGAAEEAEGQDSGGVAERVGQNTPQLGSTVSGWLMPHSGFT